MVTGTTSDGNSPFRIYWLRLWLTLTLHIFVNRGLEVMAQESRDDDI